MIKLQSNSIKANIVEDAEKSLSEVFFKIDDIALKNQRKVL